MAVAHLHMTFAHSGHLGSRLRRPVRSSCRWIKWSSFEFCFYDVNNIPLNLRVHLKAHNIHPIIIFARRANSYSAMKFYTIAVASFLFLSTPALAHPQPISDIQLVSPLDAHAFNAREAHFVPAVEELWKRKGGGGGSGKGGGGSGGKGGSESTGSTGGGSAPGYVPTTLAGFAPRDCCSHSRHIFNVLTDRQAKAKALHPPPQEAPPSRVLESSLHSEEGGSTAVDLQCHTHPGPALL